MSTCLCSEQLHVWTGIFQRPQNHWKHRKHLILVTLWIFFCLYKPQVGNLSKKYWIKQPGTLAMSLPVIHLNGPFIGSYYKEDTAQHGAPYSSDSETSLSLKPLLPQAFHLKACFLYLPSLRFEVQSGTFHLPGQWVDRRKLDLIISASPCRGYFLLRAWNLVVVPVSWVSKQDEYVLYWFKMLQLLVYIAVVAGRVH